MKPSKQRLGRLPSVNEILENPRLKSLMERVNKMEVTAGVRQYVDRMRQELSRRSLDMPIPSIGELTERAARYILRSRSAAPARVINATGQFWPPGLTGPPLADEAIIAATEWMQHYHRASAADVEQTVANAAGGEGAMACNTPSAALWLALAAARGAGSLVIARGELGTLDDGTRISDLASSLDLPILEVGASDGVTLDDYRQAIGTGGKCVLRVEALPHATRPVDERPSLAELAGVVKSQQGVLIHYLHNGALLDRDDQGSEEATVAASLRRGSDLVVVRGDGEIGGPACGLVVGRRRLVEAMHREPLAPLVRLHPSMISALAVTLTLLKSAEHPVGSLPIAALQATPLENLRLRAERIAAQLVSLDPVEEAKVVTLEAGPSASGGRRAPSYGVQVSFAGDWLDRARQSLADQQPRVEGVWQGDQLLLDLRTVFAGEDMQIVSRFESIAPVEIPVEAIEIPITTDPPN